LILSPGYNPNIIITTTTTNIIIIIFDLVGDPFFFFFFFFSLEIPGVFFSPVTQTQTQKSTFVEQQGMSLTRTSQEKKNKQTQKRKTHSQQCFYICL
jgi:hypothetical protein